MNNLIRRITPMIVLDDIKPPLERYRALGFDVVETEDEGCVGVTAKNSHFILATAACLRGDFPADAVAPLVGQTIPYIHVTSVSEAERRLPGHAVVVDRVATHHGTNEALVRDSGGYFILADQVPAGTA